MFNLFSTCSRMNIGVVSVFFAVTSLCVSSCRRADMPMEVEKPVSESSFTLSLPSPFEAVSTKSLLVAPDIETRVSCVTLAAYSAGKLRAKAHYKDVSEMRNMKFELYNGLPYTIYALVNMGDMSDSIPTMESAMTELEYRIPSYTGSSTSLESLGLPMAGKLDYKPNVSPSSSIGVKRLVAKVEAHLQCSWDGAKIESVKVFNLNGRLSPFGDSVAESSSDIMPVQEFCAGTLDKEGTFTLDVHFLCAGEPSRSGYRNGCRLF